MKKLLFLCCILLFLTSCWGSDVAVNSDTQTDISTESIDATEDNLWLSPELQRIVQQLEGKNLDEIASFDCTQSNITDPLLREQYINDCSLLKTEAEIDYYNRFLSLDIDEVHPLRDDFTQEYQEYIDTIPSYEEFLSVNKVDDDIVISDCTGISNVDNGDDCIISQEQYQDTIWKAIPYEDFVFQKQAEITQERSMFELQKSEYRKFIQYLQNPSN